MSRYFPHTPYAEDQPLAYTILTTHVAMRAVTLGTLLGIATTSARTAIPALRRPNAAPFAARLLRSCAASIAVTLGVTGVGLAARMRGRERIEWQDRSWRLLENRGQLETDDWTCAGMGGGAAAAALVMGGRTGWRGFVGAAGLGSVGGMMGYVAWRYGVNGGKFPERLARKEERKGL
ncbi:hypothetical protein ISF_03810 [Cordyceps fumosorosea ARSEF 2679]|uniref:Uncharacterized protein n=1 Tax=Cordyceps fumosorosea (strain ARSEF 2679) TaxID=1081104 RepID=A0A167ZKT4_CORFA|nr:hypothetical protein ISF_03810 [Cordyceps fumosorosea ARSEF 2679]OAA67634.1 hypothetical protein ISF_03810 [Cordyceps fumosorosea ARSEF 2679]